MNKDVNERAAPFLNKAFKVKIKAFGQMPKNVFFFFKKCARSSHLVLETMGTKEDGR